MPFRGDKHAGLTSEPYPLLATRGLFKALIARSQLAWSRRTILPDQAGQPLGRECQEGVIIQRLPDVAFQPEAGIPIHQQNDPTTCPIGFTGSNNWTTVTTYQVEANRKVILVDAWIRFSNPYTGLITSARLLVNGTPIPFGVRVQDEAPADPNIRAAVLGRNLIEIQIRRAAATTGIDYGLYEGGILGYDVADVYPMNRRILK